MRKITLSAGFAVLLVHSAAFAQQPPPAPPPPAAPPAPAPAPPPATATTPPPAPPATAPAPPPPPATTPAPSPAPPAAGAPPAPPAYPYGPPPGYRPPPTYYYYPPPAARRGVYRPFTMSGGLGAGVLSSPGSDERDNNLGYSYLARFGFGLSPDFVVFIGVDGIGVSEPEYDRAQTNFLLGVQYFVVSRLYLRAALGIASVSEDVDYEGSSSAGQAFLGGIGLELAQGESVAFGVEYSSTLSRFSRATGTYFGNSVSFFISFF